MNQTNSTTEKIRDWQVAGGILLRDGSILLVENVRRNGSVDWSTPGGVVDAGESPLEGLTREVEEETGLRASEWSDLLYQVSVDAPDAGFHLEVDAFMALTFSGELVIDDPDGIVVSAKYVPLGEVASQMSQSPRWVAEPLVAHLSRAVDQGHRFEYFVEGLGNEATVKRLDID